jgi:hypothetical protein
MALTVKRIIKTNKLAVLLSLISIAFLSNILHLQADDEGDVIDSIVGSGVVGFADGIINIDDEENDEYGIDNGLTEFEESILGLERKFVRDNTWLFLNPNDESPVGRISAQFVWVVEEAGEWVNVITEDEIGWMNPGFVPPTEELDELLTDLFGWGLSVHFENMETGFTYQFNEEYIYPSASVKKAVHGLYIYKQAELGLIDLDSIAWGMACPTFSVRALVSRNIRVSDDYATFVLMEMFGLMGYLEFIEEIGGNASYVGSWVINSQLTVQEASIFARAIYEYLESDGIYSDEFRDHLLNNEYPFIVSDYPVASKTGWYPPFAWHDMAIVYAPSPYALIILSARSGWTDQDYEDFRIISMAFQEFNDKWFFR